MRTTGHWWGGAEGGPQINQALSILVNHAPAAPHIPNGAAVQAEPPGFGKAFTLADRPDRRSGRHRDGWSGLGPDLPLSFPSPRVRTRMEALPTERRKDGDHSNGARNEDMSTLVPIPKSHF